MKKQSFKIAALLLLLLVVAFSCSSQGEKGGTTASDAVVTTKGQAAITFDKTTHDFGKLITGEKVAYAFRFTNTGDQPLLITGIRSGCGCTVGDYPKDPVRPGEQGRINVVFNSSGRRGFQQESVTVLNNSALSAVTLRITAEVLQQ